MLSGAIVRSRTGGRAGEYGWVAGITPTGRVSVKFCSDGWQIAYKRDNVVAVLSEEGNDDDDAAAIAAGVMSSDRYLRWRNENCRFLLRQRQQSLERRGGGEEEEEQQARAQQQRRRRSERERQVHQHPSLPVTDRTTTENDRKTMMLLGTIAYPITGGRAAQYGWVANITPTERVSIKFESDGRQISYKKDNVVVVDENDDDARAVVSSARYRKWRADNAILLRRQSVRGGGYEDRTATRDTRLRERERQDNLRQSWEDSVDRLRHGVESEGQRRRHQEELQRREQEEHQSRQGEGHHRRQREERQRRQREEPQRRERERDEQRSRERDEQQRRERDEARGQPQRATRERRQREPFQTETRQRVQVTTTQTATQFSPSIGNNADPVVSEQRRGRGADFATQRQLMRMQVWHSLDNNADPVVPPRPLPPSTTHPVTCPLCRARHPYRPQVPGGGRRQHQGCSRPRLSHGASYSADVDTASSSSSSGFPDTDDACPVCYETTGCRAVLPCRHCVCVDCFGRLGGHVCR